VRVGTGGGYSDLELGLLVPAALADDPTTIATTVHPLQLLDEDLPDPDHDFRVDPTVTGDNVVQTPAARRPPG
jgi:5-formyltetrahydrofolate cyclo-ligase